MMESTDVMSVSMPSFNSSVIASRSEVSREIIRPDV
jgi:hypothetical protein